MKKKTYTYCIGDPNLFRTISGSGNQKERWFKLVEAFEIKGKGCLVRSRNRYKGTMTESMVFVPGASITIENGWRKLKGMQ